MTSLAAKTGTGIKDAQRLTIFFYKEGGKLGSIVLHLKKTLSITC